MLTTSIKVLCASIVTLCATDSIAAVPFWLDPLRKGPGFKKDHCIGISLRQYSAILWDIPAGADWISMCQKTPVTLIVDGSTYNFPTPHVCALADSRGVTHAVTTGLVAGISVAAGIATGGPGAVVGGAVAPFAYKISEALAQQNPLNVWGNVYISDNTCDVTNSEAISLPEAAKGFVVPK